jgi:hypothetical protein
VLATLPRTHTPKPETLSLACPLSVSDENPDHWKQKEAEAREAEEERRALWEEQVCVWCALAHTHGQSAHCRPPLAPSPPRARSLLKRRCTYRPSVIYLIVNKLFCLSPPPTFCHSLSPSLSVTHSLSLSLSLTLTHTHTHTHSLSVSLSLTHSHTHTHTLSVSHTHTHLLTHTLTRFLMAVGSLMGLPCGQESEWGRKASGRP